MHIFHNRRSRFRSSGSMKAIKLKEILMRCNIKAVKSEICASHTLAASSCVRASDFSFSSHTSHCWCSKWVWKISLWHKISSFRVWMMRIKLTHINQVASIFGAINLLSKIHTKVTNAFCSSIRKFLVCAKREMSVSRNMQKHVLNRFLHSFERDKSCSKLLKFLSTNFAS